MAWIDHLGVTPASTKGCWYLETAGRSIWKWIRSYRHQYIMLVARFQARKGSSLTCDYCNIEA